MWLLGSSQKMAAHIVLWRRLNIKAILLPPKVKCSQPCKSWVILIPACSALNFHSLRALGAAAIWLLRSQAQLKKQTRSPKYLSFFIYTAEWRGSLQEVTSLPGQCRHFHWWGPLWLDRAYSGVMSQRGGQQDRSEARPDCIVGSLVSTPNRGTVEGYMMAWLRGKKKMKGGKWTLPGNSNLLLQGNCVFIVASGDRVALKRAYFTHPHTIF